MSAIFHPAPNKATPIRLVNVQTLGACCGTFETFEQAEEYLDRQGYKDYYREGNTVCFAGGVNC